MDILQCSRTKRLPKGNVVGVGPKDTEEKPPEKSEPHSVKPSQQLVKDARKPAILRDVVGLGWTSQEEVEYVGFNITMDSVKPSDTYLQAIRDFPRPRDITGIRSWFGLINQVSYALSQTCSSPPLSSAGRRSCRMLSRAPRM